ncbi:hypothetical protein D3C73_1545480 [compost metagenome]
MITTFGLDQLAGVRVFIHFHHARATLLLWRTGRAPSDGLGVEDGDDVAQTFVIAFHQAD